MGMISVFFKVAYLADMKLVGDYVNNGPMKQIPKDRFWVEFSSERKKAISSSSSIDSLLTN
jgi:hypothetical protein